MLDAPQRLMLRYINQRVATTTAGNFFQYQGTLTIDLDSFTSTTKDALEMLKNVSSLKLESLDASESQWSHVDKLASQIGNSVHHLHLVYDGTTNYTTAYTSIKAILAKFQHLHSLTLQVYSGANC
jgi:hypothetical protein